MEKWISDKISNELKNLIDLKYLKQEDPHIRALAYHLYENNGVGLAAPQVNESLQILVIDCSNKDNEFEPRVLINPTIKEQSKIYKEYEEGCLSFPNHYFSVSRPESLLVDFVDLDGNKKEKLFSGFEAICVQHEIDHLSGTLFTAYLSRLKRQIIVKKMQKFKKNINKSI